MNTQLTILIESKYKDINIPPVNTNFWESFYDSLASNFLSMLFYVAVLLIMAIVIFSISYRVSEHRKKYGLIDFGAFLLLCALVLIPLINIFGSSLHAINNPMKKNIERITTIEDNAYNNILMKYDLKDLKKEEFEFRVDVNNYSDDEYNKNLKQVRVSYTDLEKETTYPLVFEFKDNEPILLKTNTVNERFIKSLEK